MPITISNPEQKTVTIDTVEINSFAVDLENQAIHIVYDEGTVDTGFVIVNADRMIKLTGADFAAAIAAADGYANAMPSGSVSVYDALKQALYDQLMSATGIVGSVS